MTLALWKLILTLLGVAVAVSGMWLAKNWHFDIGTCAILVGGIIIGASQ
jgi:heme O synthase-like polyprenyltransferase